MQVISPYCHEISHEKLRLKRPLFWLNGSNMSRTGHR